MGNFLKKLFISCLFIIVGLQTVVYAADKKGIISEACYKLSGIYPSKFEINTTNSFVPVLNPNVGV